jgi:hypothetical protein
LKIFSNRSQEMFIQYLAEQGHNAARSERKPRRNIQYNDLGMQIKAGRGGPFNLLMSSIATAVARIDNLDFLSDVIPKTTTYRQFKEKKAKEAKQASEVEAGQMTLDGKKPMRNGIGANGHVEEGIDGLTNGTQDHVEDKYYPRPGSSSRTNHSLNGAFVDRTASHAHPNGEDVSMSQ